MSLTKLLLTPLGLYGGRLARRPYGQDMIFDIRRLAQAWNVPVRTVLDVGANVGQSALGFSEAFPAARIVSFEPHPQTFAKLQAAVSGRANIQAHNLALGDSTGEVDFFEYDNPLINSRVADAAYPHRKGFIPRVIQVAQQSLDDFCRGAGIQHIDYLKVDTEGFETAVITGALGMLSQARIGFISCEVGISEEGKASSPTELAALLEPHGYTMLATYYDYLIAEPPLFANGNVLFIPPLAKLGELADR